MKLALVTETYPPEVNGVAMTLQRLCTGLVKNGNTVQVVRPRQFKGDAARMVDGVDEQPVPGLPLPGYEGLHFGLPAAGKLKRLWQQNRPDVVHVATEGPLGWSALRAARALDLPLVSSFHTNFHSYGKHYGYGKFIRIALAWLRYVHNRTQATFAPSDDLIELLKKENFHNVKLLGRGVDTELFDPAKRSAELRREWGVERDDVPVVIYVGRMAGEKNVPLTLEAFDKFRETHPEARCVLIGDGPERARIEKQRSDLHFAGMRRGDDLARHVASGDLFFFGSITETFGNVVTEAMASGLAVLAYDYAAPRKYIRNGENGTIVPYDDAEAFVAAADKLAQEPESWPHLRENARKTALALSWGEIIAGYERDVTAIIEGRDAEALRK